MTSVSQRAIWVASAAALFALLPLLLPRLTEPLHHIEYDLRTRWAAGDPASHEVAVIMIDDATLAAFRGQRGWQEMWWPFRRSVYQLVFDYLADCGARAVAFDFDFREQMRDADADVDLEAFARSLQDRPETPAVLAVELDEDGQQSSWALKTVSVAGGEGWPFEQGNLGVYGVPKPPASVQLELYDAAPYHGFVNAHLDADRTVRRAALLARLPSGAYLPALSLAAALAARHERSVRVVDQAIEIGDHRLALTPAGDMLVRYCAEDRFTKYSFGWVYASARAAGRGLERAEAPFQDTPLPAASEWKDKIILIGSSALALHDLKITPLKEYPGVLVHASVLDTILSGQALRLLPRGMNLALASALGAFMAFAVLKKQLLGMMRWALIVGPPLATIAAGFWLFQHRFLVVDLALPIGNSATAYALSYTGAYLLEGRRSRAITGLFQHYVPAAVVRTLVEHPERVNLQGERRIVTVFFSDIAGFTEISNRPAFREDPALLTAHLNDYLTRMTEALHRHGATLDKYIGDAVVAFFNAPLLQPDHARAACVAALECQEVVARFNAEARARALPEFRTRIGVSTGMVMVGNVGSRLRYNYTVIGQTVNLGSRLEGSNKVYGTSIMASEETVKHAGEDVVTREIDYVRVPGIVEGAAPLRLYEVMGEPRSITQERQRIRGEFVAALALYRDHQFVAARQQFERLAALGDPVSRVYVARCAEYERSPPQGELIYEIHSK